MLYEKIKLPKLLSSFLFLLGQYSMDIFLFHTFIFKFYMHDTIYWSANPIAIYMTMLAVCVAIAWLLTQLKEAICWDKMVNRLSGLTQS